MITIRSWKSSGIECLTYDMKCSVINSPWILKINLRSIITEFYKHGTEHQIEQSIGIFLWCF